jgi:hypothetical protein
MDTSSRLEATDLNGRRVVFVALGDPARRTMARHPGLISEATCEEAP